MNNLWRVYLSVFAAMLTFLIVGCEDDDSVAITGEWQGSELMLTALTGDEHRTEMPSGWTESLTINDDGTFTFQSTQDGETIAGSGEWQQTGNQLTLDYQGEGDLVYSFSGSRLVLEGQVPEGHFQLIFTKVSD